MFVDWYMMEKQWDEHFYLQPSEDIRYLYMCEALSV